MACSGCQSWQSQHELVIARCGPYSPSEGQTTRGNNGVPFHGCGSAEDFGCANYDCGCAFSVLEPLARSGQLSELCGGNPNGAHGCIDDGKDVPMWSGHLGNHTHAGCLTGTAGAGAGATQVAAKGGGGGLCIPGTDVCIPSIGDILKAIVEAFTGGKSLAEIALRAMEIWGGAVLMAGGLVMILRILKGTQIGGGVARAGRPVTRQGRRVRRVVRRELARVPAPAAAAEAV